MKSIQLLCKHCKYHPKDKDDAIEHLKTHQHLYVEDEEIKKVEEEDCSESIVGDILEDVAGLAIGSLLSGDSPSSSDSDIGGFEGGGGESGGGGAESTW